MMCGCVGGYAAAAASLVPNQLKDVCMDAMLQLPRLCGAVYVVLTGLHTHTT